MNREESILKAIVEKQSWEEIIYHIVGVEKLDPWDIDLVRLTSSFIRFLSQVQELDFRIPAKAVFVAGILLRLKAEYLTLFEEVEEVEEKRPAEEMAVPKLAELGIPLKRIPRRQITLEELIYALRKALAVEERRTQRRLRARAAAVAELTEEDVARRIEEVLRKILGLMERLRSDRITFEQLVPSPDREEIVKNFVPVLHLDQEKKIAVEQEEFFKEIWIAKRTS